MQIKPEEVYVGRSYGSRQVVITPELVARYCQSIEHSHPWYTGDSPFGGPVAPALVLHSEVYRDTSWYLSAFGNLHAKQEWELFQPALVGERVTALRTIVDRYGKRNREYVVNEVTVLGEDGRLLSRARTHQSFLLEEAGQNQGIVIDKERERRPERRFDVEAEAVLEELRGEPKEITLDMCQKFSGPGKNYHTDREMARKLGFPDIVVQGMMSLCLLSEMMTQRFGTGWFVGGRMNVNLVNVIWQGETVTAAGIVVDHRPEGTARRAELRVWCEKADGTKAVISSASAID
jgi:acyl dehydratase